MRSSDGVVAAVVVDHAAAVEDVAPEHPLELGVGVDAVRAGGDEDGDVALAGCRASPRRCARSISRRGCARVMSHTEMATFCPGLTSDAQRRAVDRRPHGRQQRAVRRRDPPGRNTGSMTVTRAVREIDLEAVAAVVETHSHRPRVYHRADQAGRRRDGRTGHRGAARQSAARARCCAEPVQLLTYECDALPHLRRDAGARRAAGLGGRRCRRWCGSARAKGVPFVARGHGTGLSGGALPVPGGVVISLARLNRVLDVDIPNRHVTVEPGVTNLEITRQVAPFGYYYAPDPSSQQVCSIGGNVAENSGGAHCLKYGFTVHHVLEVEAVLPDGSLTRIGSRLADEPGPDLLGLLVGSEGTLAVVTKVVVRILRRPETVQTLLAAYDTHQRGRHGGVGDHRRRHHPGGRGDDGRAGDQGGRGRRAPELSAGRHHADRRARRPGRRGARALRDGRGDLPPHRRHARSKWRADEAHRHAHLEGAQGGVCGDGPRVAELLRAGRRGAAHEAARGARPHPRARRSAAASASATSSTPATATCIRSSATTSRCRGRRSWPRRWPARS